MKGYWHFTAISVAIGFLSLYFNSYWALGSLLIWLFYLYYSERLGKVTIILSLAFTLFFITYIPIIDDEAVENYPPEANQLTGRIIGNINATSEKIDFILHDNSSETKLLVFYFPDKEEYNPIENHPDIKHGATCVIHGKIELPDRSRNPGQFDYRNYLLTKGITHQIIVDSLAEVQCEGSSFLNRIFMTRKFLLKHVEKNVSKETAAWLSALVLGNDSLLNEETVELFQRWSLSHILAISGLHVGLVVAFIYFLLIKLNLFTKEKAEWIMILFLPVYALIAGGEPSVWRASTMVLIFILLSKSKLNFSGTDILSIVFILLIFFDKYIVYHVGFQLSFIVTFGIILSKKWIFTSSSSLLQVLKISFVAQMMILPLQLAYFSTFQPLSILLNVIIVPYFSFIVIPLMFLLLIFSPFSVVTSVFDAVFIQVHQQVLYFVEWIDRVLNFPWIIGPLPVLLALLYYFLFFIFMNKLQKEQLKQAFKYGFGITVLIMCFAIRPYLSPVGTITMLDIGQGDAFVMELPYRKAVIFIDAGARFTFEDMEPTDNVYKQVIKPYLYSRGISHVDALFLTHEDIDHVGSVSYMIEELNIEKIVTSNIYELSDETKLFWKKNDIELLQVERNDNLMIGDQSIHVLAPYKNNGSANENSLVLHTNLGGKDWLFTGDIGVDEEKEILRTYPNLTVDILKVAHHGSNTSTDRKFVNQLKPAYGLISVGETNSYGHPNPVVIETLQSGEVHVLRTDLDGAVQFRFKNGDGSFYKFLP
ncbi:DNA internalization-related competence protein ComEC/Rec2 [Virgibacillus profundi]|uniref:DNA internalization-related competence protein ComEC/Rec2 n=1 Tax=Virgibacillus profundi TaxID=2024555 RepID=A0A2A2IB98_9BACI|nr:DNA internalization-related competence protein ComEC/Rec2 [Virgibacillus profundi]PAV28999.1 DNA internalization-related competence protein ComEC/Rec2 [Virgibacillus profundi]PXY53167.1 DNA internalization-related competence protein ComEC/Rec2 [Virgibacillus profundi]